MGIKKIIICHQRNSCIGCGSCSMLAPKNWKMNEEDGKSDLQNGKMKGNKMVVAQIDEADYEANKDAAEACPVQCIKLD